MSNLATRKAAAGLVSGVLGFTALVFVLAALMVGLGPTESSLNGMPEAQFGGSR